MNGLAPPRTRFLWQRPIKRPMWEPSGGTVSPSSVVHTRAFGAPFVGMGAQFLTPASTIHPRAFGTPKLNLVIFLTSVVHVRAFGVPKLNLRITMTSVIHTRAIGTATVSRAAVTISPASVIHTRAFGTPALQVDTTIYPTSVIHQRGFGRPRVGGPWSDPAVIQRRIFMVDWWGVATFEENPMETV